MDNTTFEKIAMALLQGRFVDRQTMLSEYEALSKPSNRNEVDAWLGRIGRTTATTSDSSAFFCAMKNQNEDQKPTTRAMLEVRDYIWPVMEFLNMAHAAIGGQDLLVPGAVLQRSRLVTGIENDQVQQAVLRSLPAKFPPMSSEGSIDKVVAKVLKKMADLGYLTIKNEDEGIFAVTGRVQYMNDVIEFINEHGGVEADDAGIDDEDHVEIHQDRLL